MHGGFSLHERKYEIRTSSKDWEQMGAYNSKHSFVNSNSQLNYERGWMRDSMAGQRAHNTPPNWNILQTQTIWRTLTGFSFRVRDNIFLQRPIWIQIPNWWAADAEKFGKSVLYRQRQWVSGLQIRVKLCFYDKYILPLEEMHLETYNKYI